VIGRLSRRSGGNGSNRQPAPRAIIDIGSNTVRLVIYGGAPRAPTVLFNEKVVAQLGLGVGRDGRLAEAGMTLALQGLARFAAILRDLGIETVDTVATAAVREAANSAEFLNRVRETGLSPRVLSGAEEAEASAQGVLGAFPGASGIVADLGGGSLELVQVGAGQFERGTTLKLGTLRLAEMRQAHGADMRKVIGQQFKSWSGEPGQPLYLVGGTWRAMAVYCMNRADYPLTDPHDYELSPAEAKSLADTLGAASPARLADGDRISTMRAGKLPDAAVLLHALLKRLAPSRLIFSSWGLREGLLYASLSPAARAQDPLLAGIMDFGASNGVPPVLATRVAGWTAGAIPAPGAGDERLRLAATTLALAAMDVEPNLRTQHAIEWALFKRWVSISASERAMLAATICGNGNVSDLPAELFRLATPQQLERAFAWGLAIRLCRRLGAGALPSLEASRLTVEDGQLRLFIAGSHRALFSQPTEKDLRLLADRLGLRGAVTIGSTDAGAEAASTPRVERV
jgi:exopolyphosphatase/guanosine-5'-triphosphate,3'-diphosphate pyrophosphatase